jgi:ABC-type sugar transport system ATPase subunit
MGDRIAVMKEGKIEQLGTPTEIYHTPKNLFIATFIGSPEMNLIEGNLVQKIPAAKNSRDSILGIRPEAFRVSAGSLQGNEVELGAFKVELAENLGGQQMLHGKLDQQNVRILVDSLDKISIGQTIPLKIDLTKAHLFDKKTGLHQSL